MLIPMARAGCCQVRRGREAVAVARTCGERHLLVGNTVHSGPSSKVLCYHWRGDPSAQTGARFVACVVAVGLGTMSLRPPPRIGPPELVAAADQCGLTSSVVVLLEVDGERIGGLQLLGDARRPVDGAHAELARPVAEVLAARLADLRELERLRGLLRMAAEGQEAP